MASKQPRRSDLTSNLWFMAQNTKATMFVLDVMIFCTERLKEWRKYTIYFHLTWPQVKTLCQNSDKSNIFGRSCWQNWFPPILLLHSNIHINWHNITHNGRRSLSEFPSCYYQVAECHQHVYRCPVTGVAKKSTSKFNAVDDWWTKTPWKHIP